MCPPCLPPIICPPRPLDLPRLGGAAARCRFWAPRGLPRYAYRTLRSGFSNQLRYPAVNAVLIIRLPAIIRGFVEFKAWSNRLSKNFIKNKIKYLK